MDYILTILFFAILIWGFTKLKDTLLRAWMRIGLYVCTAILAIGGAWAAIYHFGGYHEHHREKWAYEGDTRYLKHTCCLEDWGSCPDCLICEIVDDLLGCPPYQIGERHDPRSEYDKDYGKPSKTKIKERFEEIRDKASDNNETDNTNNQGENIIIPTPTPTPTPDFDDNTYDNTPTRCSTCGGSGVCTSCQGKGGHFEDTGYYIGEYSPSWIPCPSCNGSRKCYMCYGTGYL